MDAKPKVVYMVSEPGGVGKSTLTKAFVYYLENRLCLKDKEGKKRRPKVALVDADSGNGNLARAHVSAIQMDYRNEAEFAASIEMLGSEHDFIVFDTPAGCIDRMLSFTDNFKNFKSMHDVHGYEIILVNVINDTLSAALSVRKAVRIWRGIFRHVVIRAEHAETAAFSFWDQVSAELANNNGLAMDVILMAKPAFRIIDSQNKPFFDILKDKTVERDVENELRRFVEEANCGFRKIFRIGESF